jgi:septum formation protein
MSQPRLILASASPRRRELLLQAGYEFEVHPPEIDEDDYPPQTLPADIAQRLAQLKAQALADRFYNDVILAADTVVAFGDVSLGKPTDAEHALSMLELLSGTTHVVITGVTVIRPATRFSISTRVMSSVRMRPLTEKEIARYVDTGDWQGKAGGYGIQDQRTDPFVTRIAGSQSNIVGLPMEAARELLSSAGIEPKTSLPTKQRPQKGLPEITDRESREIQNPKQRPAV